MNAELHLDHEPKAYVWYRRLIGLYPGVFRERYATEMFRAFDEDWRRIGGKSLGSRWLYCLHVMSDFGRTLPREWLAAMPPLTRVSLFGIGTAFSFLLVGRQVLTIAYCLFLCAFLALCWVTLMRPSRLGIALSVSLTGILGMVAFWTTVLLTGHIHSPDPEEANQVFGWTIAALCLVVLLMIPLAIGNSRLGSCASWMTQRLRRRSPHDNLTFRFGLFFLCGVFIEGAQLVVGRPAAGQLMDGGLLALPCMFLSYHVSKIWQNRNCPTDASTGS